MKVFKTFIYLVLGLLFLESCCTAKDPVVPAIEPPDTYDVLKTSSYESDAEFLNFHLSSCSGDTSAQNNAALFWHADGKIFHLSDTTSLAASKCIAKYTKDFNFEKYDFLYVYHGSINNVVRWDMDYRLFISHKKKQILLKSIVVGTGGCAGSGLRGRSYYSILQVPKLPSGYTFRAEGRY
jgi:hypothetical protein